MDEKSYFETEVQAIAQENFLLLNLPFCPNIKEQCKISCACHREIEIRRHTYKPGDRQWEVRNFNCTHVLISGIIRIRP